jgi:MFS family permease
MNISPTLLRSAIVAALGGLLFGFDTAVISGTTGALERVFQLSKAALGFTVASALIGTIIGAIAAGRPADRFGRRAVLLVIAVLYFVSAIGSALAWDWYSFLFFRFLGGLGVGAASVVSPLYIAEISPAPVRGRLVALTQFNIVFGILVAFFSNYLVARWLPDAEAWRWMLGVEAVPAAAFFFLLFAIPESPRWLILRAGSMKRAPFSPGSAPIAGVSIRRWRKSAPRPSWSAAEWTSHFSPANTCARSCSPSPSRLSTSSPGSTRSCTTRRISSA